MVATALRIAVLAVAFALAAAAWQLTDRPDSAPGAALTADFQLVDHRDRLATPADFAGQWLLVFFGFTRCPDECPTTLMTLSRVMEGIGSAAERVQPLMITVDPEHDTPATLSGYVAYFHPAIVGLTGTPDQIAYAAERFRTYYSIEPAIEHSASLYLVRPDRSFAAMYPVGTGADALIADLREQLGYPGGRDHERQPTASNELLTSSAPSR